MNKCHKIVLYNKRKIPIELVRYINQYVPSKNCLICNQYGISYSSIYICNSKNITRNNIGLYIFYNITNRG